MVFVLAVAAFGFGYLYTSRRCENHYRAFISQRLELLCH